MRDGMATFDGVSVAVTRDRPSARPVERAATLTRVWNARPAASRGGALPVLAIAALVLVAACGGGYAHWLARRGDGAAVVSPAPSLDVTPDASAPESEAPPERPPSRRRPNPAHGAGRDRTAGRRTRPRRLRAVHRQRREPLLLSR